MTCNRCAQDFPEDEMVYRDRRMTHEGRTQGNPYCPECAAKEKREAYEAAREDAHDERRRR